LKQGFSPWASSSRKTDSAKPWLENENLSITVPFGGRKVPSESLEALEKEKLNGFGDFVIA
jgi:hypothetical protein